MWSLCTSVRSAAETADAEGTVCDPPPRGGSALPAEGCAGGSGPAGGAGGEGTAATALVAGSSRAGTGASGKAGLGGASVSNSSALWSRGTAHACLGLDPGRQGKLTVTPRGREPDGRQCWGVCALGWLIGI